MPSSSAILNNLKGSSTEYDPQIVGSLQQFQKQGDVVMILHPSLMDMIDSLTRAKLKLQQIQFTVLPYGTSLLSLTIDASFL